MMNFALDAVLDTSVIHPAEVGGPEFDRNQTSRCLIVYDGSHGHATFCVGWDLQKEIDDCGSHDVQDLGLTPPEPGIWIWDGIYTCKLGSCWEDQVTDSEPEGHFRRPTVDEWRRLQDGEDPWDGADWIDPGSEQ